jgi:hypothetical protein
MEMVFLRRLCSDESPLEDGLLVLPDFLYFLIRIRKIKINLILSSDRDHHHPLLLPDQKLNAVKRYLPHSPE